jgi:hypothetical protein
MVLLKNLKVYHWLIRDAIHRVSNCQRILRQVGEVRIESHGIAVAIEIPAFVESSHHIEGVREARSRVKHILGGSSGRIVLICLRIGQSCSVIFREAACFHFLSSLCSNFLNFIFSNSRTSSFTGRENTELLLLSISKLFLEVKDVVIE